VTRGWPTSLVALQSRNFRLLWIGLLLSFSGSTMQNAALLWHVSLLAAPGSKALALGMVGLTRVVPIVIFSIISGVVADALDRRRVMLVTQSAAAFVAVALAVISFREVQALWLIYVLAAMGGAVSTFDIPARQALIPALVPREHLPNAITLNTIMFQLASVVGPAMAGIVIAFGGVQMAYLLNAVSFAFVLGALLMMRGLQGRPEASGGGLQDVSVGAAMEGLRFVMRAPLIRSTMFLDFFATFFASATALLPIFAQDILRVGARGYGWLYAAPALGSLLMSIVMVPMVERIRRRGQSIVWAVVGHGVVTVIFGLSHMFWLTFACLALIGATDTVSTVLRNIIRQLETPDRLRGRMMGVNLVFFQGGPQLGELEAGAVANWFGAPVSVISGGIGCLMATAWIAAATPALRHYQADRAGSIPDSR
jgi:MFS family permease